MRTKVFVFIAVSLILVAALTCGLLASMQSAAGRRSVWIGVYTAAQAERGKAEYERTCIRCHAANFDCIQDANLLGDFAPRVSIRGTDFMERWREDTGFSLFTYIKTGMPPRTEPNAKIVEFTDQTALDLVAYVFQGNEFPPSDRELTLNDLRSIRIQEKTGSRTLPSFSVVQAVGCLKQLTPGVWELSAAAEPMRIRQLTKPTDEDLQAAAQEQLGNFEFDLQNIGYLGREFDANQHEGHKMLVQGILIRQPPNIRIDVRQMVDVADSCEP